MAIRVTCPKCHTRFNVSDKFAGQMGPCPKCKAKIKVPALSEEIKIAVPEIGPKDSQGRSILKPITRKDTKLTRVQITIIACCIIGYLLCALVMNLMTADKSQFSMPILWLAAVLIAPPICYAAYTFLRDQELGSFLGKELWVRILICGLIYAFLWLAMPLGKFAFSDSYEMGSWVLALVLMLSIGAAAGMLSLDFSYLSGLLHYGMYLGLCIIGRLIAGIGALPGSVGAPVEEKLKQNEIDPLEGLMQISNFSSELVACLFGS
jgi:hypothetical protein